LRCVPGQQLPEFPAQSSYKVSPQDDRLLGPKSYPLKKVGVLVFPNKIDEKIGKLPLREGWEYAAFNVDRKIFSIDEDWPDPRTSWRKLFSYSLPGKRWVPFVDRTEYRDIDHAFYRTKFPIDISEKLSTGISPVLLRKGFEVMDLTPFRRSCNGMSYREILNFVRREYKMEGILFFSCIADSYTLSIHKMGGKKTFKSKFGLNMAYEGFLLDTESGKSLFHYSGMLSALPEDKIVVSVPVVFLDDVGLPIENLEGKKVKVRDRIVDPDWLVNRALDRLKGQGYGSNNQVTVGGGFARNIPHSAQHQQVE
jgi:hypothetical protein